jgi:Xaa-Pro aminopeptidase
LAIVHDVTWESFFLFSRSGERIALVGNLDQENFVRSGCYSEVATYTAGVRADFLGFLNRLNPSSIAVNFSAENPSADGLTHGMFLKLMNYLKGTPFEDNIVSAEELCGKLRSRKLPSEISRLRRSAEVAAAVWNRSVRDICAGMNEKEIAALIDANIRETDGEPSFATIVNAGDKTAPGHGLPSDAILARGDLLHVDFGVRMDDYCSDIQRLLYIPRFGEKQAPPSLTEAFEHVRDIITATGKLCLPGALGHEVDGLARRMLEENGYDVYQHALGHQLGRGVHDGGAIIGPKWERYGGTPSIEFEEGNVFTLELEIILPGIGCVGLEEDMCITSSGAEFLCQRQMELTIK